MEVSMHMNRNLLHIKPKPFPKVQKPIISCRLVMQSGVKSGNLYQVLSLSSPNVGFDEIKKAYKSMALQYHPDVCNSTPLTKEESTKRFVEMRQAYEVLSDPNSRRIYDMGLEDNTSEGDFPREVWERQLSGLRTRCAERIMKKKRGMDS